MTRDHSAPPEGTMAYRIHFTPQDLARTRVADTPIPLVELDLAVRALQDRSQPARLDAWRQRTRTRLAPEARMALALVPSVGWSPMFLTPPRSGSIEELVEQVNATPRSRVRAELAQIAERQSLPSWAHRLPDDAELFARLSEGVGSLYASLLGPYWDGITDLFRADRSVRLRHVLDGGVERLLTQANPRWMRWDPPVLEIQMANGVEHDLLLEGQGVVLVPSVFHTRTIVEDEGEPQPIVSYPAGLEHPLDGLTVVTPPADRATGAVAALLGTTRATVLTLVAEHPGSSTKELAALARLAPASASEHATVLRNAGLIRTNRHRNTALHSVTNLGLALLNSPPQSRRATAVFHPRRP
jgi:DNA-binding transcriptional ArsR family regulator